MLKPRMPEADEQQVKDKVTICHADKSGTQKTQKV